MLSYRLEPLAVAVFEGRVGVVDYGYQAQLEAGPGAVRTVRGRWSEVHQRTNGEWLMISVAGGPDGER